MKRFAQGLTVLFFLVGLALGKDVYYCDFERHTGHLADPWTWTNASAAVESTGTGDATKLAVGDYVRSGTVSTVWGTQWYKVASVVDNNSFTIAPVFQQTTRTDDTGTGMWSDISETNYGATTALATCSFSWYTTDTARTAGDILYVRANQTFLTAGKDLELDEDGTAAELLEIIGCDAVTNDPWVDASDVKPILSFGGTAFKVNVYPDDWKFTRLDFRNSSGTSGNVLVSGSKQVQFDACNFQGNTNGTDAAGFYQTAATSYFNNCSFSSNTHKNLRVASGIVYCNNCTFDAGTGTAYGIVAYAPVYLTNCQFGQSTPHGTYDLYSIYGGQIIHRNCKFAGTQSATVGALIFGEDDDQVYQAHTITTDRGTISRDAAVYRTGGATTSAKMAPTSNCGVYNPLILSPEYFTGGAFKILMDAAAAQTITIYVKGYGWTGFPTAAQLYAEASYYDNAAACSRTTLASTEVIDENTNWHALTMTIPATYPKRDGFVYVNVYLKIYEASSGVYVDIKPVTQ
jgi:hypothetical protein